MKSSLATCGRVLPLVAACTTLVTVILCYSLTIGGDTYTGGLDWPYFSDTGRDNPEYYIFAIGLTIVGLCMSIIWYANYIYQREALSAARRKETISDHISRIHIAANTLGVLSTIGLPLLSIFDTSTYPDLHFYASIWFVVLEAFAVLLNTIISRKLYTTSGSLSAEDMSPIEGEVSTNNSTREDLRFIYKWQLVVLVIFWIAFLLYLPIGLAINCSFERLTIPQCLALNLGDEYCKVTMFYKDGLTTLWDYSGCPDTNQLRSASQLILILSLIAYVTSFSRHGYK